MDVEVEQGETEIRDMVHVTDDNLLVPNLHGNGATACKLDHVVVSKCDILVVDTVVHS